MLLFFFASHLVAGVGKKNSATQLVGAPGTRRRISNNINNNNKVKSNKSSKQVK